MKEATIKKEAKQFLNRGEYDRAFKHLELLGSSEFCNYLFKNNSWIFEGPISEHFWLRYFPHSSIFNEIIVSENAINLLHHYFSKNKTISVELLKRLAKEYPDFLTVVIRVNRAFLNPIHATSLQFLRYHPNEDLKNHFILFNSLSQNESRLFKHVEESLSLIANSKIIDVLNHVAIWFEEKRAISLIDPQHQVANYDLNHFTEVINFFLGIYLKMPNKECQSFSLNDSKEVYSLRGILNECMMLGEQKLLHQHPVWKTLDLIAEYWYFIVGTLNTYCFDLNFDIIPLKDEILFKPKSIFRLNLWFSGITKLQHWYAHTRIENEEIIHSAITSGHLYIHNKKGVDLEMNIEGAIRMNIANAVAKDYCLLDSDVLGIKTSELVKILNGFNSNAYGRFVLPIDQLNSLYPQNWLLNILKTIESFGMLEVNSSPLKILSEERFNTLLTSELGPQISTIGLVNIKNLLSTDLEKTKIFDRFKPNISLTSKPFIKINNNYISFNGVLGESNIMTSVLINMLDKNSLWRKSVEKSETAKMEENLALLFKEAGFNNFVFGKQFEGGDFDIMIHQNNLIFYIELKRSKIRIHLDEAWDELQNSLLKASHQIEKGELYLKHNFIVLKDELLKDLRINTNDLFEIRLFPLIVSTSFEHDHELIRGKHLKITYFELQQILLRIINGKMKSDLGELINSITNNDYWKGIENLYSPKKEEEVTLRIKKK